ncbi:hypothetical protein [Sphingomonas flavescens]|jgi:hypothetical protein|uniref:hypothetical protein n=1 Tax=Sphingomonas flavescens TaxID=3132797 RepID=UPI002805766F|nr:hypothetical protein [Sphingomonas limnosediminicola]
MKRIALTLAAFSLSTAASAASPLLGSWSVDVTKLPVPPEARPKSVTMTFSDAGAGKWRTNVDILGGDGSVRQMTSTYALDGSAAPIEGDQMEADTSAVKLPAPNVMVLALGKGGIPASTRIYTVAPDGKTMTETAVYFGADGKPVMRTNSFNRLR